MSRRDPRLWFPLALAAAGSAVVIGLLLLPKLGGGRPTDPPPSGPPDLHAAAAGGGWVGVRPDLSPQMKCQELAGLLHVRAPGLRVVFGDAPGRACCVLDGEAAPPTAPPTEEYADCWRGAALCVADDPAAHDGAHSCRAGDFYLFGDLELMERVRPAAERLHFGPWRGAGEPAAPPP